MLAGNLHMEGHGVLVGVDLHHTHLFAVLTDVEREVDETGLVLLDEGTEVLEVLLEVLEFALLYGVRADEDERFCHHAPFPPLPTGAIASIVTKTARMALLRRITLPRTWVIRARGGRAESQAAPPH